MSTEKNQPEQEQLTPEQIEERKAQLKEFYINQMDLLKPQLEYETILASIEEQRFKRTTMIYRHAELTAGPEQESEGKQKKERTLKKDQ